MPTRTSANAVSPVTVFAAGIACMAFATTRAMRAARRLDLRGKVVLIAGGSRGLGLVMARQLAESGAKVAICGRDLETLAHATGELQQISDSVIGVLADLTQPYDLRSLVNEVRERLGPIDVLINNAGIIQVAPMAHMTEDDYRQAMDLHFWAPYRLTELVLPDMRQRGGGRIVNISSIGGRTTPPHLAPYVASKHALVGYSRAMRMELAREKIFVTTVAPGLMRTGSPRNVIVKGQVEAEYAWFKLFDSIPLTSMSARRAAAKIINAMTHGDADLTLTLSAKAAARVQALFPNLSASLGAAVNAMLPRPVAPGGTPPTAFGYEAESAFTRSPLMSLTERAAQENNEVVG